MAKVQELTVEIRDIFGKRRNRRLRESGKIPAVLYGHRQECVHLAIPAEDVLAAYRHGSRCVALQGALFEKALIKDCQWDTWGSEVLHLDLTRVGEHEKIQMSVPIELRGEAPGAREGGVVKHLLHALEIECEASAIPEKIELSINHLEFGQILCVRELTLPSGVVAITDAAMQVVTCQAAVEIEEKKPGEETSAEPEVIGRKKADEAENEE